MSTIEILKRGNVRYSDGHIMREVFLIDIRDGVLSVRRRNENGQYYMLHIHMSKIDHVSYKDNLKLEER